MPAAALLWLLSARAACPDPLPLVRGARRALLEARLDDAAAGLQDATAALGCGAPASPTLLAELWQTWGALRYAEGDTAAARLAMAAASRQDAGLWCPELGTELYDLYLDARGDAACTGLLLLPALPDGYAAALDGQVAAPDAREVEAGPHLLQVIHPDGSARYASILTVSEHAVLAAPLGDLPPLVPASARRLRQGALVTGGLAAAAAGGTWYAAWRQGEAIDAAPGRRGAYAALERQDRLAGVTYGLLMLSAGSLTLYFVL